MVRNRVMETKHLSNPSLELLKCHIYLDNGLHRAKMKNLRHCVLCLAQSSGRGCCCCRGLSVRQETRPVIFKVLNEIIESKKKYV